MRIAGEMVRLAVCPARPVREKDLLWSRSRSPCAHAVTGQELPGVAGAPPVTGPGM